MSRRRAAAASAARRFSRLTTDIVVRRPTLWRLFRRPVGRLFGRLAPRWDAMRTPGHLAPLERALEAVVPPPRCALDLGTGTGAAALAVATRWPETEVVGVDLAEEMLAVAREKLSLELTTRVRFARADGSALPYRDASFDLVTLANMIPFFDELARVVRPGGHVVFSFSNGAATPIYVAPEVLERELSTRGFTNFAEFAAGTGTAVLAWKPVPD